MNDHPVLAQVAIGYSPMIDRQRQVVATRLTIFPERPDSAPDAAALLAALSEIWPDAEPVQAPPVLLNLAGEALLRSMLDAAPGAQFMLEAPVFMASDAGTAAALHKLHAAGTVLLVKGRPLTPLPAELLALFTHSIVEAGDDRTPFAQASAPRARRITTVQAGARSSADIEAAFGRGAVAVLGWPFDDPLPRPVGRVAVPSDVKTVMELISGVDRGLPVPQLEAVLRRDPALAFRLMSYLNSPAFGLRVEINSFGHAIMMLGYQRLKRWLALLLASSARGHDSRPVLHAAIRRGLLMEALASDEGDSELRSEMFICGVFSLLDRLLQQPFSELLPAVPVPDRVQQALRGDGGPYLPYLLLVQAIEQESVFDIREQAEALMLGTATVNRAVLAALRSARQLDG